MSLLPSGAAIEIYVEQAARFMAARIEIAVRNLMDAEGLTKDDLRNRGLIVHHPDGRVVLMLDGSPRVEWREIPADADQQEGGDT